MKSLGDKIKTLRTKSGFNQTQIAKFLGCDQSYISKIEKDDRDLTIDILEKLSTLFGITLSDFDNDIEEVSSLQLAFRSSEIYEEDLNAIADINKIALNLKEMKRFEVLSCEE